MARRSSLDTLRRGKPAGSDGAPEAGGADEAPPEIKTTTLRLTGDAWRQLRMLAIERDCTSHDLLVDGLNMVFEAHGKPQLAKHRPNVREAQRRRQEGQG